jgi:methylmalonyl-CoA mutase
MKKTNPSLMPAGEAVYSLKNRTRFVTAAALFDGHDASINIMRRILQATGAEVIHLGHNRSAQEIVDCAVCEDVQGIALSSYQGGHVEFFKYIIDLLKQAGAPHIKVFGGGGGTITPSEIAELEAYGVTKLYSPEDGRHLGLQGLINSMLASSDFHPLAHVDWLRLPLYSTQFKALGQVLTCAEMEDREWEKDPAILAHRPEWTKIESALTPVASTTVVGITGTGGAGKSSFTDELIVRIMDRAPETKIAVLAIDPTRKKTGGALLGDRLRMNSLKRNQCYMRSFATREANVSISQATRRGIEVLKSVGFDWIFVETGGIGQADTSIVGLADINIYVMTSEFGAPTQLEKINMLDYADLVVINKFDKGGSLDALTEVRKTFRRNHREFESVDTAHYPVFATVSSRFADPGVSLVFQHLLSIKGKGKNEKRQPTALPFDARGDDFSFGLQIVPKDRSQYLSEISAAIRDYRDRAFHFCKQSGQLDAFDQVLAVEVSPGTRTELLTKVKPIRDLLDAEFKRAFDQFHALKPRYEAENFTYQVRDKDISVPLFYETLSHQAFPKVALPRYLSIADTAKFVLFENLPGYFPYTAGVFPFKRSEEDPKRQFAGEGTPARTNKRFHLLCEGEKAKRLSTAFDSVTLYGNDPDERPDIYGKIGESGVSVCTLDDAKKLYAGFDLCDPSTSVSMTINGPAPMLLAFFFNTAIDQQIEKFKRTEKREPSAEEAKAICEFTLQTVRGTVQADILKEDQAQNTCIFSTEFALRLMGDIQSYFIEHKIRNYYSVSISGYHIAEAGANPISQLAFTLANGFTYVEYYRSRGMKIDDFVPNFSFFFCNGLDPEYTVIGRVARRIWAIAMKYRYRAGDRSQKLKYHVQTSGRSLHAQELSFNDIRTTLQALLAYFDHCNSLHTNAYDEAVTTPTEESVRRAMAIQLIISKEFGWAKNENPTQGSFVVEALTDLVEEAVLLEFDRISARGGVLGAMETHYQRSKIQEESLHYETLKHSGELPLVGVNTFLNPHGDSSAGHFSEAQLTRATYTEKNEQIESLRKFQRDHTPEAARAILQLKSAAKNNENIFAALMSAARVCSLGQMTRAFYEIGGEYRRAV